MAEVKMKFVDEPPTAIWGWIRFKLQKHLERQVERGRIAKAELTALKDLARHYLKDTTLYPRIIELLNLELSNLEVRISVCQDLLYDLGKLHFSQSSVNEEREPARAGGEQKSDGMQSAENWPPSIAPIMVEEGLNPRKGEVKNE